MMKYILSDGIVLWRAWIFWNQKLLLFVIPLISLVCTLGKSHGPPAGVLAGMMLVIPRGDDC